MLVFHAILENASLQQNKNCYRLHGRQSL